MAGVKLKRQPLADDLDVNGEGLLIAIRQLMAADRGNAKHFQGA